MTIISILYRWIIIGKTGDHADLFKKYGRINSKNPDSLRYHLNYATEIFSYVFGSDEGTVIPNKEQLLSTLQSQLDKAVSLEPNNGNVNLLYAQYYYNKGIYALDSASKIKGATLTADQKTE